MIVKNRSIPIRILKLQSLLRRLNNNHSQYLTVKKDLIKWKAGYKGEVSLDYHLRGLDQERNMILHDLRIPHLDGIAQMDTLIITPKFLCILEVKNYSGTIIFDQAVKQLIRIYQNKEECFPDPIIQAERQKLKLQHFLNNLQYPPIKIYTLVVISNPSTLVKFHPEDTKAHNKVIHADGVWERLLHLDSSLNEVDRPKAQMMNLAKLLVENHKIEKINILKEYNISWKEILNGIICNNCGRSEVERFRGTWLCGNCKLSSKDAHLQALIDYALLKGENISRKEYQTFIKLKSDSAAVKQLCKCSFITKSGIGKGRAYQFETSKIIATLNDLL